VSVKKSLALTLEHSHKLRMMNIYLPGARYCPCRYRYWL